MRMPMMPITTSSSIKREAGPASHVDLTLSAGSVEPHDVSETRWTIVSVLIRVDDLAVGPVGQVLVDRDADRWT